MEKIFTEFVESMHRLYKNGMVQDKLWRTCLRARRSHWMITCTL